MQNLFTETKELQNLKNKLQQILDSLNEIVSLSPHTSYHHVLSMTSVLTAKYDAVIKEVEGYLFKQLLIHPNTVPIEDPELGKFFFIKKKEILLKGD